MPNLYLQDQPTIDEVVTVVSQLWDLNKYDDAHYFEIELARSVHLEIRVTRARCEIKVVDTAGTKVDQVSKRDDTTVVITSRS